MTPSAEPFPATALHQADGRRIPVLKSTTVVGRSPDCDVVLLHRTVSRRHAKLELKASGWSLANLSRYGTKVDGALVETHYVPLLDQSTITLGEETLTFETAIESRGSDETQLPDDPPWSTFEPTRQERKVLVELCRPLKSDVTAEPSSNKAISDAMVLSDDTIRQHLRHMFEKLDMFDVEDRSKRRVLARGAITRGIVFRREL